MTVCCTCLYVLSYNNSCCMLPTSTALLQSLSVSVCLCVFVCVQEASCGYVIILMTLYWCTECMPLAVTGLLPVILFPMMGIMESSEVCTQYMKDSNMLFVGGLLMAIAVEQWNLHKRIALRVLLIVGMRPALLMFGFMGTTAFLSMWISNTAATAMMLPITNAVLKQLCDTEAQAEEGEMGGRGAGPGTGIPKGQDNQHFFGGCTARLPCWVYLQYSTLWNVHVTDASSNYIILSFFPHRLFPGNGDIVNFASWFGFSFPNMVLMLIISWLWLLFMYLGCNMKKLFGCGTNKDGDKEPYVVIKNEYKKLGSVSFAEGCILVLFVLLVLLWFTREPGFMPGWATVLFNKDKLYVTDGTVAMLMSTLFFLIPSQLPRCGGYSENGKPLKAPPTLLNWDVVHKKMPWNIFLLVGGGFALARGSETSGLSQWLGESLAPLQSIPPVAISLLLSLLIATFTECSSNVATTTLFLPILASMAVAIKLHPLYVMLPCTICASLAFMLPVATAPNAIAFSYGNLKVMDMAKAGFVLNIIGVITINIALNTWGAAMFNLNTFPDWANVTTIPTP
uniref:Solute carrier family 13 member 2 n=1 Tax=Salmo trutta TaxID=8032 RepID=A0A673ZYK6_SALTR